MAAKSESDLRLAADVQRLGWRVGKLHGDLAGIAKEAGNIAHSSVAAAKDGGRQALEAVKAKGRRANASSRELMADHPAAIVGLSMGVGILIGLLGPAIMRSRRRVG
jgi:ElaB/YqjD/DUF883 family membrane-anchored ribosome-binding protein